MKRSLRLLILSVLIVLFFASTLYAEVLEPIRRINISPVEGSAGTGMARLLVTHETFDYEPDPTRDIKVTTLRGELSIKLIEQVGIGIAVPYLFIENQNLYSGMAAGSGRDENGIGNVSAGVNVALPQPAEGIGLVVGANTIMPTSDDDVGRKYTALEPYALLLTRDGDLSFTASAGYQIIIDENAPAGEPNSIYDNILSLQGSAIYSANEIFSVGAQVIVTSADNTLVEFVPQVRGSAENVEWGMSIDIPLSENHPQVSNIEKSLGVSLEAALKF